MFILLTYLLTLQCIVLRVVDRTRLLHLSQTLSPYIEVIMPSDNARIAPEAFCIQTVRVTII